MIEKQYYLSEPGSLPALIDVTDLSEDEVEEIVGRFKDDHWRFPGLLKGEVLEYMNGKVVIRHHFKKSKLWTNS